MSKTVLIVEDDPNTMEIVRLYLRHDGHRVLLASDGIEGLRLARAGDPDLVVLDLMLPGLDGMEVCREIRAHSDVPIIMLTARVAEEDRLAGLDLGADDYVVKPFSPRELVARVRAVLRRAAKDAPSVGPSGKIVANGLVLNQDQRTVRLADGAVVRLTPTEFQLLHMFMKAPGKTFSRDQIIERVFGYDFDGFDRVVDAHVSNLRRKITPPQSNVQYIHTVYGLGYRFGDA